MDLSASVAFHAIKKKDPLGEFIQKDRIQGDLRREVKS